MAGHSKGQDFARCKVQDGSARGGSTGRPDPGAINDIGGAAGEAAERRAAPRGRPDSGDAAPGPGLRVRYPLQHLQCGPVLPMTVWRTLASKAGAEE